MIIIVCEAERQFPHITDFGSRFACADHVLSLPGYDDDDGFYCDCYGCYGQLLLPLLLHATDAHERTHFNLRSLIANALKTVIM